MPRGCGRYCGLSALYLWNKRDAPQFSGIAFASAVSPTPNPPLLNAIQQKFKSEINSRMHILVIDDDNEIRDVFCKSFVHSGHRVTSATNGSEALELMRANEWGEDEKFHAVLVDVEMPGMNGWRVLEAIRKMPNGANLPVILFTAHGNLMSKSYAKMLGAYALLHKPIATSKVLEVINRAVDGREARQSGSRGLKIRK